MDHDDFHFEPVRGLPEALPPGELILWQGSPDPGRLCPRGVEGCAGSPATSSRSRSGGSAPRRPSVPLGAGDRCMPGRS